MGPMHVLVDHLLDPSTGLGCHRGNKRNNVPEVSEALDHLVDVAQIRDRALATRNGECVRDLESRAWSAGVFLKNFNFKVCMFEHARPRRLFDHPLMAVSSRTDSEESLADSLDW